MKEITITQPVFMDQFHCIGNACREHCCQKWDVVLDKPTYNKYVKSSDIQIREIASVHLKTLKKNHLQWAKISLTSEGLCPFLDESRLCNVHKQMGEKALSHTCSSYPRVKLRYKLEERNSLSLSCPESVRLLLSNPDAMKLREFNEIRAMANKAIDVSLRQRVINLLCANLLMIQQDKIEYNLYALSLLLFFIEKVEKGGEAFEILYPSIENYFSQLIQAMQSNKLSAHLDALAPNPELQWALLLRVQIFMRESPNIRGRKTLYHYLDKVLYFCTHEIASEQIPDRMALLSKEYDEKARPWFTARDHQWRNYFLYRIYHDNFPFRGNRESLQNYYLLIAEFFIQKSMLAAQAHYVGHIDEDVMINVMYSFHTLTQHSSEVHNKFLSEIEKVKVNDDLSALQLLL